MPITTRLIENGLQDLAVVLAAGGDGQPVVDDLCETLRAVLAAEARRWPKGTKDASGKGIGGQFMPADESGTTGGEDEAIPDPEGVAQTIGDAFRKAYKAAKAPIDGLFSSAQELMTDVENYLDGLPKIQLPDFSENLPEIFQGATHRVITALNNQLKEIDYSDVAIAIIGTSLLIGPGLAVEAMLGAGSGAGILVADLGIGLLADQALTFIEDKANDLMPWLPDNPWFNIGLSIALGIGLAALVHRLAPRKLAKLTNRAKTLEKQGKDFVDSGFVWPEDSEFLGKPIHQLKVDQGTSSFYTVRVGNQDFFLKTASVFEGDAAGRSAAASDIAKIMDLEDAVIPYRKIEIAGKTYGASPILPIEPISELTEFEGYTKIARDALKGKPERAKKMALFEFITSNTDLHAGNTVIDSSGNVRFIDFDAALNGEKWDRWRGENKLVFKNDPLDALGRSPASRSKPGLKFKKKELDDVLLKEKDFRAAIRENLEGKDRKKAYATLRLQMQRIQELSDNFDDIQPTISTLYQWRLQPPTGISDWLSLIDSGKPSFLFTVFDKAVKKIDKAKIKKEVLEELNLA